MMVLRATKRMPVILDARVLCGSGGGPDKTIINSPRYLEADGYRMRCVYLRHPEDAGFDALRQKAEDRGVDLISLADHGPFDWRVVPRLLDICRRENVQVWHGHDYKTNALGVVLKRFWPMRLVTTVHGWVQHTRRTPLYYLIDRLSLRFYERVFCVSDDLFSACRKAGVPSSRCVLLENGIDLNDFRRTHTIDAAKRAQGIPSQRFLIGAAGRLSAEKGFDLLIRAVDRLLTSGLDVELRIAGEGNEQAALQKLIDELGRGERIRLLGYCSDLRRLYEAMDIFALSSLREGLPNVLLEAMALEVPVLATRVNGVPRLVEDRRNGRLVESGSVETLVEGFREMFVDPSVRTRYAQAARQTVEDRFSFGTRMDKLRVAYDQLLRESGRS
ncbi:MAG: glycosyltransferase [Planctomycetes bacterium]|nr:glycosyltransferase [Planctomycetota bacterium]